jgi:hypothetical protein
MRKLNQKQLPKALLMLLLAAACLAGAIFVFFHGLNF